MRKSPRHPQHDARAMQIALIAPRPLDTLAVPVELDGRDGTNRAPGRRQIAANDDLSAIRAWLARVVDTKTTFENYRKEAERLLLWSLVELGKPLSSLTHEDLLAYRRFLADPANRAGAGVPAAASSRAMIRVGGRSTGRWPQPVSARRW